MDLLEHPWEAVAFRLYSLPIPEAAATGAAAWTCLAAVLAAAAAAGLWRMRVSAPAAVAVAGSMKNPLELDPSSRAAEVPSPSPEPSSKSSSQRSPDQPAAASTPKERYTAYFRDAGCVGCCDVGSDEDGDGDYEEVEEHEDGGDRDVFVSDVAADPFGWEVVRSLRPLSPTAAEMGRRQYRRSPTTLGGGSVVQLWDQGAWAGGGLTPTSSPRLRGRVVFGGAVSAF